MCIRVFAAVLQASITAVALAGPPINLGFEDCTPGNSPAGWLVPTPGFAAACSAENPAEGTSCLEFRIAEGGKPGTFGNVMQQFDAAPFRGKRVRLSGKLRLTNPGSEGGAAIWFRADGADQGSVAFANTAESPVRGSEWTPASIVLDVPENAATLNIGVMLLGAMPATRLYADAFAVEPIGDAGAGNKPWTALNDRGLANLVALAKLWGYARWFNAADEAKNIDWNQFLIAAIEKVEAAKDGASLMAVLREVFGPIMPSLDLSGGGHPVRVIDKVEEVRGLRHTGVQLAAPSGGMPSIYRSERITEKTTTDEGSRMIRGQHATAERTLVPGVSAEWLLALDVDALGTRPHAPQGAAIKPSRPDGWKPNGSDRTSRIADIIFAWNVFQHFYPYFDVTQKDWEAVLPIYLGRAAATRNADDHALTLQCLITELHDGHGRVFPVRMNGYRQPFGWAWAREDLVVADAGNVSDLKPGDVILAFNGRPMNQWWGILRERISAATDGWFRWRLLEMLPGEISTEETIRIRVRHLDGAEADVTAKRMPAGGGMAAPKVVWESRPSNGAELAPGIVYLDNNGLSDAALQKLAPKLEAAKGIVIDARGYPADAGVTILRHLIDKEVTSAQWWVPVTLEPDRKSVTWQRLPGWQVTPLAPRWTKHVAFVIDGRAISYAESCMGIVEAYKLGEIVGETTAGTNGNVNPFALPTGARVSWTGMRVLKHDGSTHHGVGIKPTVPVSRTPKGIAAGRDELIDMAVEVLKARIGADPASNPPAPVK